MSPRAFASPVALPRARRAAILILVVTLAAIAVVVAARGRAHLASAPPPAVKSRIAKGGVIVELAVEAVNPDQRGRPLREGDEASFRFTITDEVSGTPLSRLYPASWVDPRRPDEAATAEGCRARASAFVSGGLTGRAELDLNLSYVLVLNADATISVVDPRFGFGGSKLLSMIFLDSPGADWALDADQRRLFVSLPDANRVAVVDPATFKVTSSIEAGARPTRLALQPDEGYLWVTSGEGVSPEASSVTAISTRDLTVAATIHLGRGHHDLAFSEDSRTVFVTNQDEGTVSLIDAGKLAVGKEIPTGRAPSRVAFSRIAHAAYVTDAVEGSLVVVDGERRAITARIAAGPGVAGIAFDRRGRLGFAYNSERDTLQIVDAATSRIVQTGSMESGPDQVTFSDTLAYVRHRGSATVLMIPLDQVGAADKPIAVADFPGGEHAPGPAPLAETIVPAAGESAVLVANAADKIVYFYKEGMAAPMGSFNTYGHVPRAVRLVDHGLRARAPGVYETTARLKSSGAHDVVFLLDSPRLTHCFALDVAEAHDRPIAARTAVESLLAGAPLPAGKPAQIRLRLTDANTKAPRDGLTDVRVLTVLPPGVWHTRAWAKSEGDGVYSVELTPPEPGMYDVVVEARSIDLSFKSSPHVSLAVIGEPARGTP